ncbi:MAG: dihydroorotate dehydrogenase electron transfer subunit [Vicinamibacterales bacterium]
MLPVDVQAVVLDNTRISQDYHIVSLAAAEIAARARPGQFVMVKAREGTEPLLRRPFSVFALIRDDAGRPAGFTLLGKRVGPATSLLYALEKGDRVSCLGPLGRPFTLVEPPVEAWMVAGGVGLAPFAMLAETLAGAGVRTTLFFGGRRQQDIFCLETFERLATRVVLATEDGSLGFCGKVTAPLARDLAAAPLETKVMIYACGPEAMLRAVGRLASQHGRPSELAMERIMGCGLGGCYSCVVRVRDSDGRVHFVRSCREGPVFRGEDIVWD